MWNITGTFLVNWRFMLQLQWAAPLNFPVTWQWSLTFSFPSLMSFSQIQQTLLEWNCYFFTVFKLFKSRFNKFISSVFVSKNNYWLSKFIINTNKFVRKTTRNVILVFLWARTFITFNTLYITLKISITFKWNWYLIEIIFKLNCSFFLSYRLHY